MYLPAEWAPQQAVQLTWPHAGTDFAPHLAAAQKQFLAIAAAIAETTPLIVVAPEDDDDLEAGLDAAGVPADRRRLLRLPCNDIWARDHGPITVIDDGRLIHRDFRFNGWGGKYPATADDALTAALHAAGALPGVVDAVPLVLEGGAIESDGQGTILTTERCLLDDARNPGATRADMGAALRRYLGAERVLWLDPGQLEGDDTDGHIDTLARFCDPTTIAYQASEDSGDPQHAMLQALADELRALRTAEGAPYLLIPLPLPAPMHDADGRRLPAGYANFLISNEQVLVPTYDDPADTEALARLREAFPAHKVHGVDCRTLVTQNGSLHCATMQIPVL
ncbi:agmatine deiminase family protein [Algiphilus aromaticivorans]|uniref:agmatine deiminase family protein n=1 Tax=Algiphilus aromaticivorans TaxID=382454 RepID=UPI0005C16E9E|nr:agmatine deiminase family protein [Algiphilus aromaticivorans]